MKRLLVFGGLLVALVLLGPSAQAQTGTARGKVLDDQGQPVAGAKIEVDYKGGVTRKFETDTNKKGEFTQVGLQGGVYRITVSKEGYQSTYLDTRITIGDPTYLPDFKLAKPVVAKPGASGGDKAGDELRESFKKALEVTQAGKWDEAEAAYKDMLAKKPDIPEAQFNLGFVYSQKKDWAQAVAAYQKALELKPDYSEAAVALAKAYQDSGQADKAMEVMTKAAAANAGDGKLQFNMGIFFLNSGRSEEAIAAFQRAEAIDPTNADVNFHLGTLAVGQNKVPEAIARLEKYLSMSPKNAQNVATAQGLLAALKPKK